MFGHIYKKSSFLSFRSLLLLLNNQGECDRVKLTKCDTGEYDEKYHYASDILFEWHHD